MYRYIVDNVLTYTPDDLLLFRESPFAVWMERLTLENPDHGILPDVHSSDASHSAVQPDDIVATLRAEGRHVIHVNPDLIEPDRRIATLAAMRSGADFIVNGHVAVGDLSGGANLLMRTSGYSDLGDFLYIPCETRAATTIHSAFCLSFVADLLHSLQGQLPPQMLIISDGADVVPLQTEDYIHYYRAVKQRFMQAMHSFRKHRMPDPAESAHFGRWSECASAVLKQHAMRQQQGDDTLEDLLEMPSLRVASGFESTLAHYDIETAQHTKLTARSDDGFAKAEASAAAMEGTGDTLAEQARRLSPGSFGGGAAPGHTPNLARFDRPRTVAPMPDRRRAEHNRRSSDASLQNLQFIGSSITETAIGTQPSPRLGDESYAAPPPPNLRPAVQRTAEGADRVIHVGPGRLPDLEPRAPVFLPPDEVSAQKAPLQSPMEGPELRPLDSDEIYRDENSVIDMDSAPVPNLAPVVQRAETVFGRDGVKAHQFYGTDKARPEPTRDEGSDTASPFSNCLITSEDFNDS